MNTGRCHMCGYALSGLLQLGQCPECGAYYTPDTTSRLRPWPGALSICLRLGWPIALLAAACSLWPVLQVEEALVGLLLGSPFLAAITINSYFQIRWMLKRSLPERVRTQGFVAVVRMMGTVVCVIISLVLLAPLMALAACLVVAGASGGF